MGMVHKVVGGRALIPVSFDCPPATKGLQCKAYLPNKRHFLLFSVAELSGMPHHIMG